MLVSPAVLGLGLSLATLAGEIELKEMVEIVGTLYEMEGVSKVCTIYGDTALVHYLPFVSNWSLVL